jgi:predicted nucleic acid-binding protein
VASFVAVFDACVLYPAALRDLLVRLAMTGLFRARWSDDIHDEWIAAVRRERPDITREQLQRTRDLMERAVLDARVTGYEGLIPQLNLPDAGDRHVLATAIRCQAGVIVTFNLKHFPSETLATYGLEAQHPDDFVSHVFDLNPALVCATVRDQRLALVNPPRSVAELLDTFRGLGLTTAAAALQSMEAVL